MTAPDHTPERSQASCAHGGSHPDHDTIATFRRDNLAAVGESFLQVLLLAKELKLVKLGVVSVDGSKFEANASKHRSVRYDRAGELIEQLRLEIADLMERAEAADNGATEDPQALPREIARREALCARLDAARQRLEAQARARAEAERAAWEAKVAARAGRKGRAKGKQPKPPGGTPRGDEQSNQSDPDCPKLPAQPLRHEVPPRQRLPRHPGQSPVRGGVRAALFPGPKDIPEPVDVVDRFRPAREIPPLTREKPSISAPRCCGCSSASSTKRPRHPPAAPNWR